MNFMTSLAVTMVMDYHWAFFPTLDLSWPSWSLHRINGQVQIALILKCSLCLNLCAPL